jgi:hypothetical protein
MHRSATAGDGQTLRIRNVDRIAARLGFDEVDAERTQEEPSDVGRT